MIINFKQKIYVICNTESIQIFITNKIKMYPSLEEKWDLNMLIFFLICHYSFVLFQSLLFVHISCRCHVMVTRFCVQVTGTCLFSELGNGKWLTDPRPTLYFFHRFIDSWMGSVLLQWLAHLSNKNKVFKQDNIAINRPYHGFDE